MAVAGGLLVGLAMFPKSDEVNAPVAPQVTASASNKVEQPPVKVDSCGAAREAILTGTPADIERTFKALVADKSADATAREYARYYLGRDRDDRQMREMDIGLIQTACTL